MINAHKILDSVYRKTRAVYFPKVYLACVLMSSGRQNQTPLKVNILSKRSGCNEGRIRSQAADLLTTKRRAAAVKEAERANAMPVSSWVALAAKMY
jgi:hypothetical protein